MILFAPSCTARNCRGFNLVEAAIVLGVVGLVIGGIWVAAASMQRSAERSEIMAGTLKIISGLKQFYTATPLPGQDYTLTPFIAASALAPGSWIKPGGTVITPSGLEVVIWVQEQTTHRVSIAYKRVPKSLCISLLTQLSNAQMVRSYGIILMRAWGNVTDSGAITSFPISLTQADTFCNELNDVEIGFNAH